MAETVNLHVLGGNKVARDLCELVERLYLQGRSVVVWVADPERARILDGYLWTFSQNSFVPHTMWSGGESPEDPVVIVFGTPAYPQGAAVLVLAEPLPDTAAAASFSEIHEVCGGACQEERAGFWRAAGYEVTVLRAGGATPVRR